MSDLDKKISALDTLTPVADDDLIVVVDVSDTSMAATGTTKKAAKTELKGDKGDTGPAGPTGPTGAAGADGADAFVYIAYASDDSGTDFTLTFNPALDYIAIKNSTTEISTPQASDFAGLWKNYKGATGETGATGATGADGADGVVQTVVAGTGISVNSTDPANPVVSLSLGSDENFVTDAEKTVLGNTSGTNTGDQSAADFDIKDLTDSTSLRATWSGKQDALGFTPEDVSNKETSALDTSTTKYPCNNVVKSAVDGKITSGAGNADSSVSDASTTTKGKVELAIASEVTAGTDATRAVTPDALAGSSIFGVKSISVQVIDGATALTTGDGKAYIRIPSSLNGMNIVGVAAQVIVKSTSGTPTVQIARGRQASATDDFTYADVLSTLITIDANEYDSKDATTAAVINASNDDLATGDVLRIDVDVAGTGTKGLQVTINCQLP
ncbi:MAG: hypothetical protein IPM48_14550 [Saprospiraceae bacterium]|nr:hypothetical protein [Saprospiraceae bacterium]